MVWELFPSTVQASGESDQMHPSLTTFEDLFRDMAGTESGINSDVQLDKVSMLNVDDGLGFIFANLRGWRSVVDVP